MAGGRRAVVALVLSVCTWPSTRAWRTWGSLPIETDFVQYAGKFCFDYSKTSEAGLFQFTIEGLVEEGQLPAGAHPATVSPNAPCWGPCDPTGGLYLIVYDDEKAHWRAAHRDWRTLTCKERLKDASWAERLSPMPVSGIINKTVFVSEKLRPRFWYFSFAACGVQSVLTPVQYTVHAINLLQGYQQEFGVDEDGALLLQVLFTVIFSGFALFLRKGTASAGRGESFRARPLLRLIFLSVFFSAVSCLLLSGHYFTYMGDGTGHPLLEVLGVISACISKALLSVLQLLTAKGWVLFYSPHEIAWRRFTVCTLGCILITSVACEIHGQYYHDWRTTLYLYESGPGLLILLLNVVLFVEASRSMYSTYWDEVSTEVREFYRTVSASVAVYYLTLPIVCVLAGVLSPWVRRKYVARTEILARFVAMALLAYCLRPSRLDIIINSRLEQGLDSDMGDSDQEEMEECGFEARNNDSSRPLNDGMMAVSIDDTE